MLILSSLSKIQVDELGRFFFNCFLPGYHCIVMGVVVPHQLDGMFHGDFVLPHEVHDLWVGLDFSGGFSGLSPGGAISLRRGLPLPLFWGIPCVWTSSIPPCGR